MFVRVLMHEYFLIMLGRGGDLLRLCLFEWLTQQRVFMYVFIRPLFVRLCFCSLARSHALEENVNACAEAFKHL